MSKKICLSKILEMKGIFRKIKRRVEEDLVNIPDQGQESGTVLENFEYSVRPYHSIRRRVRPRGTWKVSQAPDVRRL